MWPRSLDEVAQFVEAREVWGAPLATAREQPLVGVCTDSRHYEVGHLFVPLKGERFDGHTYLPELLERPGAVALADDSWARTHRLKWEDACKSVGSAVLVVDNSLQAFRRLAGKLLVESRAQGSITIAVGGSNGKTTVKSMVLALLGGSSRGVLATRGSENGYVGIPKTICQPGLRDAMSTPIILLEVGIDAIGAMEEHIELIRPDVGVLTSLAEEHLSGLRDLATVVAEEGKLLAGSQRKVWNLDDPLICSLFFGSHRDADQRKPDWIVHSLGDQVGKICAQQNQVRYRRRTLAEAGQEVDVEVWAPGSKSPSASASFHLHQPGVHNATNLAVALATVLAAEEVLARKSGENLSPEKILDHAPVRFRGYAPPDLRMEVRTFPAGHVLIVDCYNANPSSYASALQVLLDSYKTFPKLLFLGGMRELGPDSRAKHLDLIPALSSMTDCQLYLYGTEMYDVFEELRKAPRHSPMSFLSEESEPTEWLSTLRIPADPVVVLIKGSRGLRMERLLSGLGELLSGKTG